MSVKYLYYTEDSSTGGALSAAYAVPGLDQILSMYGGERIAIHPAGVDYDTSAPETYETLADAQAAYSSYTFIYLDATAATFLDAIPPPADDVVYCVGHDLTGWGGESLNGEKYKLRVIPDLFNGHALIILAAVVLNRWERLQPWR